MAAFKKEIWATITLQPIEYNHLDDNIKEVVNVDSKIAKTIGIKYLKNYENIYHYKGTIRNEINSYLTDLISEVVFVQPKLLYVSAKGCGIRVIDNTNDFCYIDNNNFLYINNPNVNFAELNFLPDTIAEIEILIGA